MDARDMLRGGRSVDLDVVEFGRYNEAGRLVETIRGVFDIDTGELVEPVELDPGVYGVLWPGGIFSERPLVIVNRTRFDRLVAAP